jgi:putative ABC transport system ATP-binding protein
LVLSPAIVLADEPTGELDSKTGHGIIRLMEELNRTTGQTFIIVTHNPMVAEACGRVLTMTDGKLTEPRRPRARVPVKRRKV